MAHVNTLVEVGTSPNSVIQITESQNVEIRIVDINILSLPDLN
jgi:hypothetical protein